MYAGADTSAKVGFRPYGQTNPFGAAHLSAEPVNPDIESGMGAYYLNRPFDPWTLYDDVKHTDGLHGLGQMHPFKAQAWQLHGLGDVSDAVGQAVEEYVAAGKLDGDQASAIMNGSATFGDYNLPDPTDQASWASLVGLFQSTNAELQKLEMAYRTAGQPGGPMAGNAAFAAVGRDLIAYRQQYANLATQFVRYYTMMTGSTPPGLSGLGIIPVIVWVAGAAVFLITATVALYAIHAHLQQIDLNKIQATTAQVAANTQQSIAQQMAAAQASGDTATANSLAKILQTNANAAASASQNPTLTWVEDNAVWLGLGAFALLFVIPAPGGRRR